MVEKITGRSSCFIIAEAGVNHNGDINMAVKLVDAASEAGADAVKFQTFKAASLVTRNTPKAQYQAENTRDEGSQYEMLQKLELSYRDHMYLKSYCEGKGILFMSTPFDFESVDLLNSIGVPIYKISSGDLTNIPLIKYAAGMGKPIILSTGMAVPGEIGEALEAVYSAGNRDVIVLHCTTNYPTPYNEVNMNAMKTIRDMFGVETGYSDHTQGIEIPIAAAALGARVIEKHFTLDRGLPGPDHKASLEPHELKEMVRCIRNIEAAMGSGIKEMTASEKNIREAVRKSVVALKIIKKGSVIKRDDIALKRPGGGIEPKYFEEVIGRTAAVDIAEDTPVTWNEIEK